MSREGELEDRPEDKDVMEAWRQVVAGITGADPRGVDWVSSHPPWV